MAAHPRCAVAPPIVPTWGQIRLSTIFEIGRRIGRFICPIKGDLEIVPKKVDNQI